MVLHERTATALFVTLLLTITITLTISFIRAWKRDRRAFWLTFITGFILFSFLLSMRWW